MLRLRLLRPLRAALPLRVPERLQAAPRLREQGLHRAALQPDVLGQPEAVLRPRLCRPLLQHSRVEP
eukprot:15060342-Alexandrium_andersonii.AAC.1